MTRALRKAAVILKASPGVGKAVAVIIAVIVPVGVRGTFALRPRLTVVTRGSTVGVGVWRVVERKPTALISPVGNVGNKVAPAVPTGAADTESRTKSVGRFDKLDTIVASRSSKNCNEKSKAITATIAKMRARRGVNKLGKRRSTTCVDNATRVAASSN